ncbi:MAG: hypothetical protein KAI45_12920 [Melioribacteraceae bacterium]|nr:hypothetical protein [Melioribacteraceae bacterium]
MEIVPLKSSHIKKGFNCGKELLDKYLHYQAKQDVKRKLAVCFVLIDEDKKIKGYYTLSNAGIPRESLPKELAKKLPPSYSSLPATLLGRLAVDKSAVGQGFVKYLLIDAFKRSYVVSKDEIGSLAVIVAPIDDEAIEFYKKFEFILLPDSEKMMLSMKTITQLFIK